MSRISLTDDWVRVVVKRKGYRLTVYPNVDTQMHQGKTFYYNTLLELRAAENAMADLLLFLQDVMFMMADFSNMFIAEEFVDGEWEELEDE